ncbi:MAG: hypothetical protein AAB356_00355, partial [Deltaproteobacteria bacterium]
ESLSDPLLVDKDSTILLQRITDDRLFRRRAYPALADPKDTDLEPSLLRLMDSYYGSGDFETALAIGKELGDSNVTLYFRGLGYLALNKAGEAKQALQGIQPEHPLFPFANIVLAQIKVMKHDLKEAAADLRSLLELDTLKDETKNRVRLLHGQVLFEMGRHQEALAEFMQIPVRSKYYGEGLMNSAWSLVYMDSIENALPLFKEAGAGPLLTNQSREAAIVTGYLYIKSAKFELAALHFNEVTRLVALTEKNLYAYMTERPLREKYLSLLLEKPDADYGAVDTERIRALEASLAVQPLVKEYKALESIRDGLMAMQAEFGEMLAYFNNTKAGLERSSTRLETTLYRIKSGAQEAHRVSVKNEQAGPSVGNINLSFLAGIEQAVSDRWEDILKRRMNDDERRVVKLLIYEGGEDLQCTNSALVCPIMQLMTPGYKVQIPQEEFEPVARMLQTIGRDIGSISRGEEIAFERSFKGSKARMQKRIKGIQKLLKDPDRLDSGLKKSIADSEAGIKKAEDQLDTAIMEHFAKYKYEIEDFKHLVVAGREEAQKALLAEKAVKKK